MCSAGKGAYRDGADDLAQRMRALNVSMYDCTIGMVDGERDGRKMLEMIEAHGNKVEKVGGEACA